MKQGVKTAVGLMLAVLLLCGSAQAAGETYTFDECDMEITVPEGDYYILLRDMDPEDPTLPNVGLTAEQVNEIMEPGNIYLVALAHDISYELHVNVLTGEDYEEIFNYDRYSKFERNVLAAEVTREFEKQDDFQMVGDITWYEGEEAVFLVIQLDSPEGDIWGYQYQTVYNGRMITVSAASASLEEPTDEIREEVRRLAENIHFTRRLPTPQSVLEADEEEDSWSLSKTLTVSVSLLIAAVFSSMFAANAKKSRMNYQEALESVEEERKQSAHDNPEEGSEETGGDDT